MLSSASRSSAARARSQSKARAISNPLNYIRAGLLYGSLLMVTIA